MGFGAIRGYVWAMRPTRSSSPDRDHNASAVAVVKFNLRLFLFLWPQISAVAMPRPGRNSEQVSLAPANN